MLPYDQIDKGQKRIVETPFSDRHHIIGRARWLAWGLALLLAGLLLLRLGGLAGRVLATTSYPFQLDPTEGIILSEVRMLADGQNIYAPFTPEQFVSAPYPPLYYLLLLPPMK